MSSELHQSMDHAWRYFELHAQQRIAVFNFYLAISGLVAAGIGVSLQQGGRFSFAATLLGVFLALVSFIFWKLDGRVSLLIKRSEIALAEFEKLSAIEHAALFFKSEDDDLMRPRGIFSVWTYGRCFRLSFALVGGAAVMVSLLPFCMSFPIK
ncbi:hypothetical protein B7453_10425 [Pseudomonas sp. IB20]|uniref:hypothetical protein n=1 Tax=Pseudomonas sp. IB20 TaxID=1702250 RepID=UPI000B9FA533|nr:hypothetical protein [Pseudomonas sp. IB20]OZO04544.1 hypothetical protein B7453_10425 [Pseudomonas sp. IB20]